MEARVGVFLRSLRKDLGFLSVHVRLFGLHDSFSEYDIPNTSGSLPLGTHVV